MKYSLTSMFLKSLALTLVSFSSLHSQKNPADVRIVTPQDLASIRAAMPQSLLVPAKESRKILVFSRSRGYYHKSTPLGKAFFEEIQNQFSGYTFVMSDDQEDYRFEKLKKFDAIVFNNGTGVNSTISDPQIQADVIRFAQEGGGIMGIHAASDGGWHEFNQMLGYRFAGHPWTAGETHSFLLEQPGHRCVEHIGERIFDVKDEIYISREGYFIREEVRVLISMNLSDIETAAKLSKGRKRDDADYPVSYVKKFGSGRVFYTSFGHNDLVYKDTILLTHFLAGLQYVAGDLDVEDSPISLYERLSNFSGPLYYEASLKLLNMAKGTNNDGQRTEVIRICRKILADTNATDASKQLAVTALTQLGTPEAVQVASEVLDNPKLSHAALTLITSKVSGARFAEIRKAVWPKLADTSKLDMINAMALYGDQFINPLLAMAKSGAELYRIAALKSLRVCATSEQISDLVNILGSASVKVARDEVLIEIANRSKNTSALNIYEWLLSNGETSMVKQAAWTGTIVANPLGSQKIIVRYVVSDDDAMAIAAIQASRFVSGDSFTQKLAQQVAAVSPERARVLVHEIAERGTSNVASILSELLTNPNVQLEVIDVLAKAGTAAQVPALVQFLGSDDKEVQEAAGYTLEALRARNVDAALADELLGSSNTKVQSELLKVFGKRHTPLLAPTAMKFVPSSDRSVASEALKAVALTGTIQEFEQLCKVALNNPRVASPMEKLGSRINDDAALAIILLAYAKKAAPAQSSAFIELLGEFQSPDGGRYLVSLIGSATAEQEEEAVKALSKWKNAAPLQTLLKVSVSSQSERSRSLALRGVGKIIERDASMAPSEKIAILKQLLAVSKTEAQLVTTIQGFGGIPDRQVEEILSPHLQNSNSAIANAAQTAIVSSIEKMSKVNWKIKSNFNSGALPKLIDLDPSSRWSSSAMMSQSGLMWIEIDMLVEQKINSILLDTTKSKGDFPRAYELYVSNTPDDFGTPVKVGKGAALTEIATDVMGRYIKIVQTGGIGPFWSIYELKINGLPTK
ncbi:MAG: type 1 glutamine amidotransferase/HEAT repeat protein [Candidatus Azotimanducaceae bacterium]|jgi:type 1 glutamine amidotransferase/HEAT repeat protein